MTPATRSELWQLTRDLATGRVLKMDRVPFSDFDAPEEDRTGPESSSELVKGERE